MVSVPDTFSDRRPATRILTGMIHFHCPHCRTQLSAPDETDGLATRCTKCRQPITVPPLPYAEEDEPPQPRPRATAPRLTALAVVFWAFATAGAVTLAAAVVMSESVRQEAFKGLIMGLGLGLLFSVWHYLSGRYSASQVAQEQRIGEHIREHIGERIGERIGEHIGEHIEEPTGEPSRELSVEEMFCEAVSLDQQGEWARAAAVYDRIAEKIPDQQDREYARNCAREMRQKVARAGGG
jgi:hypothetical protein